MLMYRLDRIRQLIITDVEQNIDEVNTLTLEDLKDSMNVRRTNGESVAPLEGKFDEEWAASLALQAPHSLEPFHWYIRGRHHARTPSMRVDLVLEHGEPMQGA